MNRTFGGLYVILDPELTAGRDLLEIGAAALRGGASLLQLRAKHVDLPAILLERTSGSAPT